MAFTLVILGAGFFVLQLASGTEYITLQRQNVLRLLLPMGLVVLGTVGAGLIWGFILTRLAGNSISLPACVRLFLYSWLGRYVPGTVPYHAARVLAAESLGTGKTKVGASIAYETVLLLGSGAFIGCLGALIGLGGQDSALLYLLAAIPLALLLPVVLQANVLVPITNRVLRLVRRPDIGPDSFLSGRQATAIFLGYALVHVVNGFAFVLVLAALDQGDINLAMAIGAYTLGGVIGAVAIFVPSGIGVREGVIVGLLSSAAPPEEALIAAATARAISIVADVLPAAVLLGLASLRHLNRWAVGPKQLRDQSSGSILAHRPALHGNQDE